MLIQVNVSLGVDIFLIALVYIQMIRCDICDHGNMRTLSHGMQLKAGKFQHHKVLRCDLIIHHLINVVVHNRGHFPPAQALALLVLRIGQRLDAQRVVLGAAGNVKNLVEHGDVLAQRRDKTGLGHDALGLVGRHEIGEFFGKFGIFRLRADRIAGIQNRGVALLVHGLGQRCDIPLKIFNGTQPDNVINARHVKGVFTAGKAAGQICAVVSRGSDAVITGLLNPLQRLERLGRFKYDLSGVVHIIKKLAAL